MLRELTPRTLDEISSLGERLSAPIVAEAVKALGLNSEAIEATELIVTDAYHGGAEPRMDLTREKSKARLRPLLEQGVVPVVTGFIGATREGKLTTLGAEVGLLGDDSGCRAGCGRSSDLDRR